MSANSMLTIPLYLESQPGYGTRPVLYLKENMKSVVVELFIVEHNPMTENLGRSCVIKATLPDNSHLFLRSIITGDWGRLKLTIRYRDVMKMCSAPGSYECVVSILNTNRIVSENDHMDYDIVSMLPFTVTVSKAAGRDDNA